MRLTENQINCLYYVRRCDDRKKNIYSLKNVKYKTPFYYPDIYERTFNSLLKRGLLKAVPTKVLDKDWTGAIIRITYGGVLELDKDNERDIKRRRYKKKKKESDQQVNNKKKRKQKDIKNEEVFQIKKEL